jgi:hypothetical protein
MIQSESLIKQVHLYEMMATVGRSDNQFIIAIFTHDSNLPHFHVTRNLAVPDKKDKELDCSIEILQPRYYKHSYHQDELDTENVALLINLFNSKPDKYYKSGWEKCEYSG